jgi:hypothetical protein
MLCCAAPAVLQMLAISTGKLVRFLVEDGAHVNADQPYAEIEVRLNPKPNPCTLTFCEP